MSETKAVTAGIDQGLPPAGPASSLALGSWVNKNPSDVQKKRSSLVPVHGSVGYNTVAEVFGAST